MPRETSKTDVHSGLRIGDVMRSETDPGATQIHDIKTNPGIGYITAVSSGVFTSGG